MLPRSFGARFRGIAGFRSVLVHGYLDVDLDLIVRMLSDRLSDFEAFATHVAHWLIGLQEPLSDSLDRDCAT